MRPHLLLCIGLPVAVLSGCREGQAGKSPAATSARDSMSPAGAGSGNGPAVGLPAGYRARTDDPKKSIADIKFSTTAAGALDDDDGTHNQNLGHIVYRDADSASGTYVLRTTIEQLSSPEHPEAVGVLIGGRDLAGPAQRYGYFLLRGDGQYSVKRRDGDSAVVVVPFTASANVPKADASHHVTYAVAIHADADSVRLLVADKPVVAVARGAIPTDGVAGYRANHGLHVIFTPLTTSR